MNIIETLEALDKLLLDRAPVAQQRAVLNSMREQLEAYEQKAKYLTALEAENARFKANTPAAPRGFNKTGLPPLTSQM